MNFTCPSCGAEATLDVIITHDETRALMVDILHISLPLGALVARYLRLFKPMKQGLRPDRIRKLLEALVPDMKRGAISRKGALWAIPAESWKLGLERVLDAHAKGSIDVPLPDHGYLYEVLMRMADKQAGVIESQAEAAKAGGRSHTGGAQSVGQLIGDMDNAIERAQAAVDALGAPPKPVGPSPYAQRVKAEQEALRKRREEALRGDSTPGDGGTA